MAESEPPSFCSHLSNDLIGEYQPLRHAPCPRSLGPSFVVPARKYSTFTRTDWRRYDSRETKLQGVSLKNSTPSSHNKTMWQIGFILKMQGRLYVWKSVDSPGEQITFTITLTVTASCHRTRSDCPNSSDRSGSETVIYVFRVCCPKQKVFSIMAGIVSTLLIVIISIFSSAPGTWCMWSLIICRVNKGAGSWTEWLGASPAINTILCFYERTCILFFYSDPF